MIMKRRIITAAVLSVLLLLVGCVKNQRGTYYPDNEEMKNNLESKGYQVSLEDIKTDNYSGTRLVAAKAEDYIEFFRLNDASGIDLLIFEMKEKYDGYDSLVSVRDDSKFGSLLFCSTETAKNDAGIVIVNVKVD